MNTELEQRLAAYGPPPAVPRRPQRDFILKRCVECRRKRVIDRERDKCPDCTGETEGYAVTYQERLYLQGLDRLIRTRGVSMAEVARQIGVGPRSVRAHRYLVQRATLRIQYKYATYFDCELEDLRRG